MRELVRRGGGGGDERERGIGKRGREGKREKYQCNATTEIFKLKPDSRYTWKCFFYFCPIAS